MDAVAIHGDKSQTERLEAIDKFKKGEKDVLVATDIASKGLDFPDIQHVINYDMPKEIEDYVHRIGNVPASPPRPRLPGFSRSSLPCRFDNICCLFLAFLACRGLAYRCVSLTALATGQVVPGAAARRAWRRRSSTASATKRCCWT